MGDPKGFMKIKRKKEQYRPVCERTKDYGEVFVPRDVSDSEEQASRCMDCGIPFCHWGCPVGNLIPEWNDLMHNGNWKRAFTLLNATNNLPEITGRVCPAPCEYACVLGINDDAVTIRENELSIIEKAFMSGTIKPEAPFVRTGKKVAVIGSGPAGLSCAMQLNSAGHDVTVYEKDTNPGGLMRFGIPDFKLDKSIVERRIRLMEESGVKFRSGICVGKDISSQDILKEYDAVSLCGGSRVPRDLKIEGRELEGIHFAMDYLTQSNKRVSGEEYPGETIDAKGKKVLIIGGGDTGSDCVGTANRQGASCVVQIEVMPKPGECRQEEQPWPTYPFLLKTSSSHEEGVERDWAVSTKRFVGSAGKVTSIDCVRVEFNKPEDDTCPVMKEVPGSEFKIEADMVILAIGFIHPEHVGLLDDLGVEYDNRGNVKTDAGYATSVKKVFSAGDMRRGQSLIVWAISEGRKAAHNIDKYLMGYSHLPEV